MGTVVPLNRSAAAVKAADTSKRRRARRPSVAEMVNAVPPGFDLDWSQIERITGDRQFGDSDTIVATGSAETVLRKLISKFGFPRLPLNYGELNALIDYCSFFQFAVTLRDRDWLDAMRKTTSESHPEQLAALELFIADNRSALLELHTREDTLTKIGAAYREPQPEPEVAGPPAPQRIKSEVVELWLRGLRELPTRTKKYEPPAAVREVIEQMARFCEFDRVPANFGELGVVRRLYDAFYVLAIRVDRGDRRAWARDIRGRKADVHAEFERTTPELLPALTMFAAGELVQLRRWLTDNKIMTTLANRV